MKLLKYIISLSSFILKMAIVLAVMVIAFIIIADLRTFAGVMLLLAVVDINRSGW